MRPGASSGLWCSLLLPFALFSAAYHGFSPGLESMTLFICVASCVLLINEELTGQISSSETFSSRNVFFLLLTVLSVLQFGLNFRPFLCLSSVHVFHKAHKALLSNCPGSFTVGEAAVVAQLIIIISVNFVLSIIEEAYKFESSETDERIAYYKSFQVIMQTCILAVTILYTFPVSRKGYAFYIMCLALGSISLLLWSLYIGENAFMWMFNMAFEHRKRVYVFLTWGVLTCVSVLFVVYQQNKPVKEISTITRKWFHIIIAGIYFPGMIFDIEFLYLASAVAFFIFTFLEAVRVLDIWPFGAAINEAFQIFLDEKDSGFLILTHIYLLIGCSCPMWIYPPAASGFHISHMSGVISVAFGDTAASVAGSTIGRHKWKGSQKTVEGTVAAILVQLIVLLGLLSYGNVFTARNVILVLVSATATSLLEAKTTQVDNLVLPLFMFGFLSTVH